MQPFDLIGRLIKTNTNFLLMKTLTMLKFLLFFSLIHFTLSAQNAKQVSVKNFNSIAVSSGIDLYLNQSNNEALTIKGNADLIKDVVVEQKGNHLVIKYKEGINWGRLFRNESIKVYVDVKTLNSLSASGGSDVYTQNTLKADVLNLRVSGGADLDLTLNCKDLTVSASGGADVNLKGTGENMQANASGGADINAFNYIVNYARASASGGADLNIHVNKGLQASASGGADITYKGNASLKKMSNSKSGDIRHVK